MPTLPNGAPRKLEDGDARVIGQFQADSIVLKPDQGADSVILSVNSDGDLLVDGSLLDGGVTLPIGIADVTDLQDALDAKADDADISSLTDSITALSFREFAERTTGVLTDAQVVLQALVGIGGATLLSGGTNCLAYVGTNPTTASNVFTIKRYVPSTDTTTTLGTITITTAGAVTFAVSGDKALDFGDLLFVVNQATANADTADLDLLLNLAI